MRYTLIDDSGREIDSFRSVLSSAELTETALRMRTGVRLVDTATNATINARRPPVSK